MFFVVLLLLVVVVPFLIDYYVLRTWTRFVAYRKKRQAGRTWAWTLPVYRILFVCVPIVMLLYFFFSGRWDGEPRFVRWAIMGGWAFYYVPKVPIALVLLAKDAARSVTWLFEWFRERLSRNVREDEESLDLLDMKRHSRRDFLREAGWTAATVPFVVVGYGVFRTLYDFQVHRVTLPITGLPRALEGLTIAQLSDLHAGSFFSGRPMQEVVSLVSDLQPDLIVLTGDYVNNDAAELDLIRPALGRLQGALGVYGCLGNHDHYASVAEVTKGLRGASIELLVNDHHTLSIDGARLHLVGTDNTGFSQEFADLPAALSGVETHAHGEDVYILLAHDPSFWDNHVRPGHPEIDVMLCGHTHGGQIGFEVGPLRWSLSRVVYERWAGLYHEPRVQRRERGPQILYVNRGIGTVGPPLRMGIRPEITFFTLRNAVL